MFNRSFDVIFFTIILLQKKEIMKSKTRISTFDILNSQKKMRNTIKFLSPLLFSIILFTPQATFAHCDSYDGPVIKDAIKALETNNVNLALKWVDEANEEEVTTLFNKTYKLKNGDKEIYDLVETHFFETLVRLHRATEGVGYTGLKPAGSASPIVKMADKSIDKQDVDELVVKFTAHIEKVVREKYEKVKELSLVKDESLEQGRAYVAAYVDYTHTLEGIHSIIEHGSSGHSDHN